LNLYHGVTSVRHKEMKRIDYPFLLVTSSKMSDTSSVDTE